MRARKGMKIMCSLKEELAINTVRDIESRESVNAKTYSSMSS
jgi:hypothetical protein